MQIRNYKDDDWAALATFKVTDAQTEFVEPIIETLRTTSLTRDNFVMEKNGRIIGFFQIDSTSNSQCIANHLELHEVFIDHSQQGKGYGQEFILALAPFLKGKYPKSSGVCLTVNCRNTKAIRLYEFGGFVDTGDLRTEGKAGPQFILRKVI
ncbi:N-acetyltransferase family protein [Kiloniella sp.]|uniref:GNAT family N-acetyltransferase n=1 Tax=Kiloniella sp. TaxID=1938587 RepID=UPI003B01FDF0